MGKGIILRVLEGAVLSSSLSESLSKLIPGYQLEYFTEQPDYQRSYQRRVNSLHAAFLFVLDAYPPSTRFTRLTVDTLKHYAQTCKAACDLEKKTVEELQSELEKYTARLVDILLIGWRWPRDQGIKEAIACLNEAEQYVLMGQGRSDMATLTRIQQGNANEYILQLDESIPPYYDQWLSELEEIKQQNYPKTPLWFRKLSPYQQAYFAHVDSTQTDPQALLQDLNQFLRTWENIKGQSLNVETELNQIANESPPYPSWFMALNPAFKEMILVLSPHPKTIDLQLMKFVKMLSVEIIKPDFKNTFNTLIKIPEWYWVLSVKEQFFLEKVLEQSETIPEAVSFLSSRHRSLPAPANFAKHSLYKINDEGEARLIYNSRWRSSHVASRDSLSWSKSVQNRHSDANFAKVTEAAKPEQLILMQTLISPIHAVDFVPVLITDRLPELPPDLDLYKIARQAVARSPRTINVLQHNHPFNIAKFYYYTTTEDPDSLALLKEAEKHVHENPELKTLLTDYQHVLKSPLGSATFWDYDGRELFLSSLEQLIILEMGGFSYGSCVSGKDRKAIELIHSDAMMLFKEIHGAWPQFGDPKDKSARIAFVNLVAQLYCSRHQHEHAGQNAPGSEGIKTPNWYLTKDILDAIIKRVGSEKCLDYDERLASNNEVKYINKHMRADVLSENELLCKLMARQLGEHNCTLLYDALSALINEKQRFQKNKEVWTLTWFAENKKDSGPTPTGIGSIRGVMHDEHAGKDNVQRLELIFRAVLSRPIQNGTRTTATNSVYNRIRELLKPSDPTKNTQQLVDETVDEWRSLFEESKEVNASISF